MDENQQKGEELGRQLVKMAALLFKWYLDDDEADELEVLKEDIQKRLSGG